MFTQTWKKYLPVITILLKKSSQGEQVLSLNHSDFSRASGGRKMKFNFNNLQLNKGRMNSMEKHMPVASELAEVILEDDIARKIVSNLQIQFSMSNDFKLTIINNTPVAETVEAINDEVEENI